MSSLLSYRPDLSVVLAVLLLAAAGVWDVYIVKRLGLSSGETASWQLFSDSEKYPVIALLFGVFSCWVCVRTGTDPVVMVWVFVMGHIFGTMKGAT